MRNLVRRYVTQEQRKAENEGVTEDDVNEMDPHMEGDTARLKSQGEVGSKRVHGPGLTDYKG